MSQAFSIKTDLTKEEAVKALDAAAQQLIVAGASATVSVKASLMGFTKAKLVSGPSPEQTLPVLTLVVTGDDVDRIAEQLTGLLPGNPKPACPVYNVQEAAPEPEANPSDTPPTTPPPAEAGAPEAK